jgi:hypothetical protein
LINCGYSSFQDAQLISLAWKCAAATHENGVVEAIDGVSVNTLKYVKPSMGGSVKAALVALAEQSSTPPSENQLLPVLVIAIRGSKSTVDFMVNANGESEDVQSLFVRAPHSCILETIIDFHILILGWQRPTSADRITSIYSSPRRFSKLCYCTD